MTNGNKLRLGHRIQSLFCILIAPPRAFATVTLLLVIHTALVAYSAYVHSPTLDEPAHLAAGIDHWQSGEFGLYRVNPPLVRMVAALPALATGVRVDWRKRQDPTARDEFVAGDGIIAARGEQSLLLMAMSRWACVPFTWIGGIVCYFWARDLFGSRAGVLAATLWCFSPNILAHASLITPDVPATALFLAACYLFWRWLRSPTWELAILAGTVLGLAELTKLTFVFLYPFLPVAWALYRYSDRRYSDREQIGRRGPAHERAMLVACLVLSVVVINLGYGFEHSFTKLGEFQFVSRLLTGEQTGTVGNRFAGSVVANVPVPLPADYLLGIDVQRSDFERCARLSYLAGEFKETGWWYYYLYGLAIKAPLGVWGLVLMTAALRVTRRKPPSCCLRDELFLLFPAVLILSIVSCQTGFSEHFRYVMPLAPFVFVWISQLVASATESSVAPGWHAWPSQAVGAFRPVAVEGGAGQYPLRIALATGFLLWAIGSSLWSFPHCLSYFNELAGGSAGGHAHLLGSNADWGQDLRYLKWWLDDHPEVDTIQLAYCGRVDPARLGIRFTTPPSHASATGRMAALKPGWYAVSVNFLRGYPSAAPDGQGGARFYELHALSYFLEMRPTAVAGTSIYIFHV